MKSKILILLLFCSFFTFGQSVPNTNTFSLQDVVNVVGGTSLTQAFSNSVDAYFDPTYKGSKDRLSNFRNYIIPSCTPPTVTTIAITSITSSSANSGGNVTADGGCSVTVRGIEWSYYSNFSSILGSTSNGTGTGSFTSSMSGLADNTTFYVRAYATNSAGTGYGATLSFTTLPSCTLPTVTTASITGILATSATGGGNVTATGGCAVTARGVCWSTSTNPTIANSHTTDGSGTGSFTSNINSLAPNTTYYVRAYATNSAGTAYGSQVSFTTLPSCSTLPTVTTASITSILCTYATSGGNVTSDGGCSITAIGVCWSTSTNPTISNSHTTDGSNTSSFISNMSGLTPNTTYYVRAYATNSVGISYGGQVSFTTTTLNYPTILLTREIVASTCGFTGNFTSTLALAQAACQDFKDSADGVCSITAYNSITVRGASISVGVQLYNDSNNCNLEVFSGYYLYSINTSSRSIIYILNGVIQSVTPCP